jgi:hypothetical protein
MKHLTIKILLTIALAMVGAQAQSTPIVLGPGDADWEDSIPGNPKADDIETIVGTTTELVELYKSDAPDTDKPQTESGPFASSYDTTFDNEPLDPNDALIEHISGNSIDCAECYLLVKDGKQVPIWYVFDLGDSGLNWDGLMALDLNGFWPDNGAISHVSIFGTLNNVPGPAPFILMGIGLLVISLGRLVKVS